MSTLQTLTEAFAELEREADAYPLNETGVHRAARHRVRVPLVAASIVGACGVAAGLALMGNSHRAPAATDAGAPEPTARSTAAPPPFRVPQSPAELARRFRVVLGGTATFTVTAVGAPVRMVMPEAPTRSGAVRNVVPAKPNGAAIVGRLTADGVTGGFDLQIYRAAKGDRAFCDLIVGCKLRRMADGSTLAVGRDRLEGAANGLTYDVDLVRSDGVAFLMHVSNERDPKGDSPLLASEPPLSPKQMIAIVTSERW
jgi:hypothetical protein